MSTSTKIYKGFQTIIPSEIRKKLNLKEGDIAEWFIDEKGTVNISFRKKATLKL